MKGTETKSNSDRAPIYWSHEAVIEKRQDAMGLWKLTRRAGSEPDDTERMVDYG